MKQGKVLNSFLQLIKKLLLLFEKYKFEKIRKKPVVFKALYMQNIQLK